MPGQLIEKALAFRDEVIASGKTVHSLVSTSLILVHTQEGKMIEYHKCYVPFRDCSKYHLPVQYLYILQCFRKHEEGIRNEFISQRVSEKFSLEPLRGMGALGPAGGLQHPGKTASTLSPEAGGHCRSRVRRAVYRAIQ